MRPLQSIVRIIFCCLLALSCWQEGAAKPVTTNDFETLFPDAEKSMDRAANFAIHYKLRLDHSEVLALTGSYSSDGEIGLVLLRSSENKKDVQNTAKRLAKLLSPGAVVMPFAGKEPSAAIILPDTPDLSNYLFGVVQLLFTQEPMKNRKLTELIKWEGGALVARLTSTEVNNRGTVEVMVDPRIYHVGSLFVITKGRGKVDYRQFLAQTPLRIYGRAVYNYSDADLKEGRRDTGAKHVLCYDYRVSSSDPSTFIIASNNKKVYYAGNVERVREALESGYHIPAIEYPTTACPWPGEPKQTPNTQTTNDTPDDTPTPDTTPTDGSEEDTTPSGPADGTPAEPVEFTPLPELNRELLNTTPKDALKRYLETLRRV